MIRLANPPPASTNISYGHWFVSLLLHLISEILSDLQILVQSFPLAQEFVFCSFICSQLQAEYINGPGIVVQQFTCYLGRPYPIVKCRTESQLLHSQPSSLPTHLERQPLNCHPHGRPGWASWPWLWPGPVLAFANRWEVSIFLSFALCHSFKYIRGESVEGEWEIGELRNSN